MLRRIEVYTSEGWVGVFSARFEVYEYARPGAVEHGRGCYNQPVWERLLAMPSPYDTGFNRRTGSLANTSFWFTDAGWEAIIRPLRLLWRELAKSCLPFRIRQLDDRHGLPVAHQDWAQVALRVRHDDVQASELYRHGG